MTYGRNGSELIRTATQFLFYEQSYQILEKKNFNSNSMKL